MVIIMRYIDLIDGLNLDAHPDRIVVIEYGSMFTYEIGHLGISPALMKCSVGYALGAK